MFALAVPVFAFFVMTERRVERGGYPLVDLQLFRTRAFALGLALRHAAQPV